MTFHGDFHWDFLCRSWYLVDFNTKREYLYFGTVDSSVRFYLTASGTVSNSLANWEIV